MRSLDVNTECMAPFQRLNVCCSHILTGKLSTNVASPKILGDSYEVGFSYRLGFGLVYMVVSQNRGTPT